MSTTKRPVGALLGVRHTSSPSMRLISLSDKFNVRRLRRPSKFWMRWMRIRDRFSDTIFPIFGSRVTSGTGGGSRGAPFASAPGAGAGSAPAEDSYTPSTWGNVKAAKALDQPLPN